MEYPVEKEDREDRALMLRVLELHKSALMNVRGPAKFGYTGSTLGNSLKHATHDLLCEIHRRTKQSATRTKKFKTR